MQKLSTTQLQEVKELLSTPKNIVITAHRNPDGDAIGSALAIHNVLQNEGHNLKVVMPTPYPKFLHWLPNNDLVINYIFNKEESQTAFREADVIFCLDFNATNRVDKLEDELKNAKATKIMIDHHLEPEAFCDYTISDITSPATCQLVYDFICDIDRCDKITADVATALYTGIMTDTGSFRFNSTTAKTHLVVAKLIEAGAVNSDIHMRIYDSFSHSKLKFWGHSLANKMTYLPEYKTAFIHISNKELDEFNHQNGDAEGLVNFPLGIDGIEFAALFIEKDGMIKISFRSKSYFKANEFSRDNFSGGGHKNAAGGKSDDSLAETVVRFKGLLKDYKSQLLNE